MRSSFLKSHCWAEIDLDALRHNFALIQGNVPGKPVCAVVKADAYGHGDLAVAHTLARAGAAWFAVSSLQEALRLRQGGIRQPILILGYTPPEQAPLLAQHSITQALFSLEYAKALSQAATQPVLCHLKVDTGMGRIGFGFLQSPAEALRQMEQCFALPGLQITGMFQHFAVADSLCDADRDYTQRQHRLFLQAAQALRDKGHPLPTLHCCNSAGQLLHPEWALDLVRAGIILYGCAPSGEVPFAGAQPVMTVKTLVSQVKELQPGESVSYGRTFTARQPLRVATCCIGYADGYDRGLSNQGVLTLHGQPAPVVGRVCMDQLLVDVTHIPNVQAGDEAVVFGPGACDTADTIAAKTGTINYEVLCAVSRRVPRLYLEGGVVQDYADYLL